MRIKCGKKIILTFTCHLGISSNWFRFNEQSTISYVKLEGWRIQLYEQSSITFGKATYTWFTRIHGIVGCLWSRPGRMNSSTIFKYNQRILEKNEIHDFEFQARGGEAGMGPKDT